MRLLQPFSHPFIWVKIQLAAIQNIKSSIYLFFLSIFFASTSFSQSENQELWSLLKRQEGVEVYSQRISCSDQSISVPFDYIVFKVLNNSEELKKISLKFEIYFEEGCNGCENNLETTTEIILEAGKSIEASCLNFEDRLAYFILNPNFADSWKYTHSEVYIQLIK